MLKGPQANEQCKHEVRDGTQVWSSPHAQMVGKGYGGVGKPEYPGRMD